MISDVSEIMKHGNNEKGKAEGLFKNKPTCFLCKSNLHFAYRCSMAKLIRDEKMPIPSKFCMVHCERFSEKCKDNLCGLYETPKGKLISLTCKHKNRHFLLCSRMPCHLISERYFQRYLKKS